MQSIFSSAKLLFLFFETLSKRVGFPKEKKERKERKEKGRNVRIRCLGYGEINFFLILIG